MKLDPFYLIVDSADWIERLVPLGVKLVQLRMKNVGEDRLRDEVRRAKSICSTHGCQFILNDYWRIAIDEGCDYVHLGQEDLATADTGAIRAAGMKLGISTHDNAELETALAAEPDYVALGPIWPTILKKMEWGPQGVDRLTQWRERIGEIQLVGIGGITVERAAQVLQRGANSAAVVTDITLNGDPEGRTQYWLSATKPWRSPSSRS